MKNLLVFLCACWLAGCSSRIPVTYDYDINYRFDGLKRYEWVELEKNAVQSLEDKRYQEAIDQILAQKGFIHKPESSDKADFLLRTHWVTDKKTNIDSYYQLWGGYPAIRHGIYYPGLPPTLIGGEVKREYQVGTLVLDVIDHSMNQVVWRGSVSSLLDIYQSLTPEQRMTLTLQKVTQMLQHFPPR